MSASIYEVLDRLGEQTTSEADKGSRLQRLFAQLLCTDPVLRRPVQRRVAVTGVARPGRQAGRGHPVAVDRLTGGNVAIQGKFFDAD